MTNGQHELEQQLRHLSQDFPYPRTPRIRTPRLGSARRSRTRRRRALGRLAGAAAIALVVVLVAVPPVRAAVGEFLRIGAVRIFQGEPGAAPPTIPAGALTVLDLPGELSLAAARRAVDYQLRLPGELGLPDRVFVFDLPESDGEPAMAMVWLEPELINVPRAALYVLPPSPVVNKLLPQSVEQLIVNDQPAVWAEGAHYLELPLEAGTLRLYVPGGVLIWTEGSHTYRLETGAGLEAALRIAASLQ